ncbi:MAG: hypothetical protein LC620_08375, partial [Halobacteriales archaeon]|nr:hypothetical protein [Halobacteriales archaeon]
AGSVSILAGAMLYGKEEIYKDPWSMDAGNGNLWLTIAAILAVLAYLEGLFAIRPLDRKLGVILRGLKGPPNAEQGAAIAALGARIGKMSAVSTAMVALALVGMVLRRLTERARLITGGFVGRGIAFPPGLWSSWL